MTTHRLHGNDARRRDEGVGQGGLAVVDVGDDGHVLCEGGERRRVSERERRPGLGLDRRALSGERAPVRGPHRDAPPDRRHYKGLRSTPVYASLFQVSRAGQGPKPGEAGRREKKRKKRCCVRASMLAHPAPPVLSDLHHTHPDVFLLVHQGPDLVDGELYYGGRGERGECGRVPLRRREGRAGVCLFVLRGGRACARSWRLLRVEQAARWYLSASGSEVKGRGGRGGGGAGPGRGEAGRSARETVAAGRALSFSSLTSCDIHLSTHTPV